ncbi:MAG: DUF4145 domain-containing protein [Chloroflexota bacterium]
MKPPYTNPDILERFDELIREGERLFAEHVQRSSDVNPVSITQWTTSSLNLLDKLSVSTNRFVSEFEIHAPFRSPGKLNLGLALGVLKSAKEEYHLGLAIDYHLSVSASVFSSLLDEADYLLSKRYLRAAAVLAGAALEQGLKSRARSTGIEVTAKDTINPVIDKLKKEGIINEVDAKRLGVLAAIRNDAAHGGEFPYPETEIRGMIDEVSKALERFLGYR